MPITAAPPLPERATAGQLAELLGVSERAILGRTSDGRLPRAEEGRVDLRTVIRAGVDSCADDQRSRGRGDVTLREARERRHVLERLGPWLLVQKAPEQIARVALAVGIPVDQVRALYAELLQVMPALANEALDRIDCPPHPELGPFETLTHLPEPNWANLAADAAPTSDSGIRGGRRRKIGRAGG